MYFDETQKQLLQNCAATNATLSARLACAGTLCIYEGAEMLNAGIPLLVASVASAATSAEFAHLSKDTSPSDMYDVAYTEPITFGHVSSETAFEDIFRSFAQRLLQFKIVLNNIQRSYTRLHSTEQALQSNKGDPNSGAYLDASMFSTLHLQALWRDLALCEQLLAQLLVSAPRVNIYWHRAQQRLPTQENFGYHEIEEIFTTIWRDQRSIIAAYQLPAFQINGPEVALKLLSLQQRFAFPPLLLDTSWHKSTYHLSRSLRQRLGSFYEQQDVKG